MASSSSDEEVYWGPYTLKEAKRDIKKYKPKKPSARLTIGVQEGTTSDNQPIYIEDDIIEISDDTLSLDSMEEEVEALQSDQSSRDNSSCLLIDLDNENQDDDVEEPLHKSGACVTDKEHGVSNQESNHYSSNLSESERQHEAYQEDIENHLESSVSRNDGMAAHRSIAECHLKDYTDNTRNTTDKLPKINVQFDDPFKDMNRFLDQICSDSSPVSNRDSTFPIPTKTVDRTPHETTVTAIPAVRSGNKLKPAQLREPFNSAGHKQRPTPPTIQRKPTPVKFEKNKQFKNIQSPVGIYIKNSPRYMPMVKVHNKEISKLPSPTSNTPVYKSKGNLALNASTVELKPVMYKPSSTRSVTVVRSVNLPASIRRICPEPLVTRHEIKLTRNVVERIIEDENLSVLEANDDISILTTMQAFIK